MHKNSLLNNLAKLKTTDLGKIRIKRNLNLDTNDVVTWCRKKISSDEAQIVKQGKNFYINVDDVQICINASSYTIITAHKNKVKEVI